MEVAVWDTYVIRKDGEVMHFDIVVPTDTTDEGVIFDFGRKYLTSKGEQGQALSSKECSFCHIESVPEHNRELIETKGYFIIEMEGCL